MKAFGFFVCAEINIREHTYPHVVPVSFGRIHMERFGGKRNLPEKE